MIGTWLAAARLCGAITATWPEVPPQRACPAALAIEVERGAWSPALVAAIAYHESRFDPTLVNATLGACGPMQVVWSADRDRQDRRCVRVRRDAWAGYRAGVAKLREARRYCVRRGEGELCVLAAYASGPAGVRGRWYRGPRRVQRDAARLRAAMGPRMAHGAGKAQS